MCWQGKCAMKRGCKCLRGKIANATCQQPAKSGRLKLPRSGRFKFAELMLARGAPNHVRSDNGPEFTARAVREWLGRVGIEDALHRARGTVGERLHRVLQRKDERRAAGQGGLLNNAGGEGADRAVQANPQLDQTSQLVGLQAACTRDLPACRAAPWPCRTNTTGGSTIGGRSLI